MMRTSIVTTLAALAVTLVTGAGCKGEKIIQPDPQTKADLEQCLRDKAEKDKLNKALGDENAALMREKASGAEIVVSIEGNALTVKPGSPGEVRPLDDKVVGEASKEFLNVVEKSRGAIQKCYEQVLKKTPSLQSKPIKMTVSASFSQGGAYQNASFAPTLGDTFDNCIRAVATKWTLSQKSQGMTYQTYVELTPS